MTTHPATSLLVGLLLTAPLTAQETTVEGFDGGSNTGGWGWGTLNQGISPLNGNPGAFLQDLTLFTAQPVLSNALGDTSLFTGDWSLRGVSSVGVDLVTLGKDFAVEGNRWLTLVLLEDAGTPQDPNDDRGWFFVGDTLVPDAGVPLDAAAGWTAFDFDVDSGALSAPAGWQPIAFGPQGIPWRQSPSTAPPPQAGHCATASDPAAGSEAAARRQGVVPLTALLAA